VKMHDLVKFINDICRECHGQCCVNFPVWVMKRDRTLHRNRCKHVGSNKLAITARFSNLSAKINNVPKKDHSYNQPCYFWYIGGCPSDKISKGCKQWVCPLIEHLIYPREFNNGEDRGGKPTQASLEIYKMLRRM